MTVHGEPPALCLARCSPPFHIATTAAARALPAYLDEGAGQQETVCQTDLHTAQQGGHAGAVCWQVAEEVDDLGVGGHWGLQHAHKGIAIHGLDGLGLQSYNKHTKQGTQHPGLPATPRPTHTQQAPSRSLLHEPAARARGGLSAVPWARQRP